MMTCTRIISTRLLGALLLSSAWLLLAPACAHQDGGDDHDHAAEGMDEHGADHEEHGGSIELTDSQIEAAGIAVERAGPGEIVRHLTLSAVVAADADTVTHINPKAPGIVRSIHKHLGQAVEVSELLCVIDSVDLGSAVADFVRARALVAAAETTLQRESALFENRLATAERVLDGAIDANRKIYTREEELHQKAVSTIRPLLEAERSLQNALLDKERQLTELRASRDARLLALEVDLAERRIRRDSARSSLLALGIDATLLEKLEPGSPLLAGTYEIRAPRGGIVAGRHITTGEYVDSQTKLFTLEDLSRVWVVASAFEEQLQSVRTGQAGRIRLHAFPEQVFEGVVTLVGHEVDVTSRAIGVRLELENPTLPGWPEGFPLRPGMFGSVDLAVDRKDADIVLPELAIVHEGEHDYVFVRTAPRRFEQRHVELGLLSGDIVEVIRGIAPGDEVVVAGTFTLKSALREGELGGGHSH